jgi:hypothetical protein
LDMIGNNGSQMENLEDIEQIEEILARIHAGKKLRKEELTLVASILQEIELQEVGRKLGADDTYQLLSALLREPSWKDERLFERFFDIQDPTTASLVMKKLCSTREGRKNYLERLLNLALGSDWDEDGDLQQDAIEFLGEFALEAKRSDVPDARRSKVLRFLIDLFEDESSSRELRQWSYVAILRAGGVVHEELPSRYAVFDFENGNRAVNWNLLEEVRQELD